eukprot:EG_transcript_2783
MRLSVVFVLTLAVSVIVSATATWGLTYSTSYGELRDMASGFVGLATVSVADFAQLVRRLIGDSSALVSSILDTEYLRSVAQLNATGQEFLSSTLDLMARAKNSTTQAQGLVTALVISFGRFMGTVITKFEAVGTDYASRLRTESASRTQTIFSSMLQDRILALQRQARLYEMGLLDVSRRADQPLDDGSCTLLGLLCATSAELQRDMFIGTASGDMMLCDVTNVSYAMYKRKGAGSETVIFYQWPPYIAGSTNFTAWKEACLAGSTSTFMNETCADGTQMEFPSCNGTCGYDPRCRTWYSVHYGTQAAVTQMSAVYIDIQRQVPVVTLSYPLYTGSPPTLAAVAASDFFFSDVDAFLATLSTSQLAAVVFNSSDLLVVGTNVACTNATAQASGVGIADVCSPALQGLGLWLAAHRGLAHNVSLELAGTLWDVFPGVVDNFSYFVAVGMNKSEVYAVITKITETSNETLHAMYPQQTARMAQLEAASLAEMDAVSAERVASLQALQAENQLHLIEMQNQTDQAFNASRLKSAQDLSTLTSTEMGSIQQLEDYHLSRVADSIGTTFSAVVGIGLGILLLGSYGTWAVTKQVQKITQVIEDVAQMKVETLEVAQKSPIREVQRIEAALGVLVARLAEYKTYMPAGLFQQGDHPEELEAHPSVLQQTAGKRLGSTHRSSTTNSLSTSRSTAVCVAAVATATRLLRRSAVAMVVNVAHFQADLVQRSAGQLKATLNNMAWNSKKVEPWTNGIIEHCLKRLAEMKKPFKYIVTAVLMQKTGAGLHSAFTAYWDNSADGICSVPYENETIHCITTVYGLKLD